MRGRGSTLPRHCHPLQFLLKSFRFSGAKTAGKRFLLWKMRFSAAKIVPRPPYMPLGTIEGSRGLRPSRALPGFWADRGGRRLQDAFRRIMIYAYAYRLLRSSSSISTEMGQSLEPLWMIALSTYSHALAVSPSSRAKFASAYSVVIWLGRCL